MRLGLLSGWVMRIFTNGILFRVRWYTPCTCISVGKKWDFMTAYNDIPDNCKMIESIIICFYSVHNNIPPPTYTAAAVCIPEISDSERVICGLSLISPFTPNPWATRSVKSTHTSVSTSACSCTISIHFCQTVVPRWTLLSWRVRSALKPSRCCLAHLIQALVITEGKHCW